MQGEFNLRYSKLFFEIQTLIFEMQNFKFKLLKIPILILISKIRRYIQTLLLKIFF